MSLVVDASIALTWCFRDKQTPATLALLQEIAQAGARAPTLWPLEVLNALQTAERRKRLTTEHRHQLVGFLRDLPVTLDYDGAARVWTATTRLAEQYRLTLYDAAYMELAQRLDLPLATLDHELRVASKSLGIKLRGASDDV